MSKLIHAIALRSSVSCLSLLCSVNTSMIKLLQIAATPVFLLLALYTELQPMSICTLETQLLKDMTVMYLLMAVFHVPSMLRRDCSC